MYDPNFERRQRASGMHLGLFAIMAAALNPFADAEPEPAPKRGLSGVFDKNYHRKRKRRQIAKASRRRNRKR
jgi:hypothetical protein